ncbi:hypothetical protein N499_0085B, partial [Wolbachia pipientis wVitA]
WDPVELFQQKYCI